MVEELSHSDDNIKQAPFPHIQSAIEATSTEKSPEDITMQLNRSFFYRSNPSSYVTLSLLGTQSEDSHMMRNVLPSHKGTCHSMSIFTIMQANRIADSYSNIQMMIAFAVAQQCKNHALV